MEVASKGYFLLLLLLIPYILWYFLYRKKNAPTMRMSDTKKYQYAPKSLRVRLIHLPMVLRYSLLARQRLPLILAGISVVVQRQVESQNKGQVLKLYQGTILMQV